MSAEIQHDTRRNRFITVVDGHEGYVEYEMAGGNLAITHTIVPSAIGGRGIAGDLVKHAFDYARAEGLKVVPVCSYAQGWVGKHPGYADLVN